MRLKRIKKMSRDQLKKKHMELNEKNYPENTNLMKYIMWHLKNRV